MLPDTTINKLKAQGLIAEKYIGKGAFGCVYTCRKNFGRKKYAAKVVEFGNDNKVKWQTENEIDILREVCSHANVVGLHGVLRDAQNIVMILEYIPGSGLLEGLLNWPHFDETDSKKVTKQLLSALSFCHSKKIIHRDVCPDNLLWYDVPTTKRPHAMPTLKLIDFNLSRKMPEYLSHLRADALGNPSYMAPECLQDEPITSFATDIWSVGVIAFLMLGGYPPFFNNNYNHLLQNIIEGSYVTPPDLWSHVSNEGADLVNRILHVNEKTRPIADELLTDKWFIKTTTSNSNQKLKIWPGQYRLKGFLYTLNEQRVKTTHRQYTLSHKERRPFVPEEEMLLLPSDTTDENFYQKNIGTNSDDLIKKTGKESGDENNNNNNNDVGINNNEKLIDSKRACFHW